MSDKNNVFDKIKHIMFDNNVFTILKFDSTEIRHTNMIEWLLSLNNYYGLKKLIKMSGRLNIDVDLINNIEFYNDKPFNVLFECDALNDRRILKERPDLLIKFECNKEKYNVLIENKIDAFENEYENGKSQTELYFNVLNELGLSNNTLFIFLDAKGNIPKCDNYFSLNYNNFYNMIIKNIDVDINENDKFIYEQYVNSIMKPVICDNDIMLDTIYAIDEDIDYKIFYNETNNRYISEHYSDKEKDDNYLVLKYIYYCIDFKDSNIIDDDIKDKLFGTKRKSYRWKYNGVYSTNLDIVKHLCIDLYENNEKELLNKIFDIKVGRDDLLSKNIYELSKNNSEWVEYLSKHKTTIDDYYIKLKDDLYVRNYITYKVMETISNELNNSKYKIEVG